MSVDDLTTFGVFISDGQQVNKETKQTIEPSLTEAGSDLDVGLKDDGQTKKPLYSAPFERSFVGATGPYVW
jgi:hypothetical protein